MGILAECSESNWCVGIVSGVVSTLIVNLAEPAWNAFNAFEGYVTISLQQ